MSDVRRRPRLAPAAAAILLTAAPTASRAQEAQAEGPVFGPFTLDAGLTVGVGYVDNVFATETDKRGDMLFILAPSAELSAETETWALTLGGEAEIGRYAEYSDDDYADAALRTEGRVRLAERTTLFGGADYAWEHEDRASPDAVAGIEPTRYEEGGAFFGLSQGFGPVDARLGANLIEYDYHDVTAVSGRRINNDDRDRLHGEYGGRVGYALADDRQVFVQGLFDDRNYDAAVDDFGFDRDSQGWRAGVGVAGRQGAVTGEAMIGVIAQDYDDPRFDDVTALDLDLEARWRPDTLTSLTFTLERDLEETTLFDGTRGQAASAYLSTGAGVVARRRVAVDLTASGWAYFTENDYRNLPRTDYVSELGARLEWRFAPHLFLAGSYAFTQRLSDAAGADYDEHALFLTLGATLQPEDLEAGPRATAGAGEIYAGLQAGQQSLVTGLTGFRQGGRGTQTADFGDFGPFVGAFAGWRTDVSGMVLGAELDGEVGDVEWSHAGGRDFSVRKTGSASLNAILGFRGRNDVLPYLRFGPALARFETDYAIEGMGAAGTSRDDVVGLRGGLGLELPLGGHLSGRIEYLFTAYPDYDFAPAGAPDSFGNAEGMARIGLVYGFGPARTEETEAPAEFGGFYAGAQIGAGTLAADNVGPRPSASTQRFTLDVSRAATTVSGGVFAGWGTVVDGLYLGAEAEADLNAGDWNIERSAPGRIFSMTRRGGAGLSARVGWAWDDAFLLYARGGANWGRFDTDYTYRGTTTNRTDTLAGLSLGLGVEAPLSDSISIRAEYVQTRYHGFDLDFGDGIDSFDPRDGRFRFGLLTRF